MEAQILNILQRLDKIEKMITPRSNINTSCVLRIAFKKTLTPYEMDGVFDILSQALNCHQCFFGVSMVQIVIDHDTELRSLHDVVTKLSTRIGLESIVATFAQEVDFEESADIIMFYKSTINDGRIIKKKIT